MSNKEKTGVGILTVTAILLALARIIPWPRSAEAQFAVNDREYSVVTVPSAKGDDALYIMEARSGKLVVFQYDPTRRQLLPKAVGDLSTMVR